MNDSARYLVGVDVGGTFTDFFFQNLETGACQIHKVPTTVGRQNEAMIQGIREILGSLDRVEMIVHGTTVATNALLERKGARTGMITTRGFRDVLEMRRRDRPQTWGLRGTFEPVIPRNLRREVQERTLADGTVRVEVDLEEVRAAAQALLADGCESLVICFLNSYANAANEERACAALRELWPNPWISRSADILAEIREFERVSTASLNAFIQPCMSRYLEEIRTAVHNENPNSRIYVVQSNGGTMSLDTACRYPIRTTLSGPAAGVVAALEIARTAGFENVITCDMGGTSFDVALIAEGRCAMSAEATLDFGMTIRTPMVEMTTIGAGGGSLAMVDTSGLVSVGPESAGADPGPACYQKGNDRPTVTDANLILGRINPDRPIGGGNQRLSMLAAEQAVAKYVAEPLGLDMVQASEAIIRIANSKMAGAIRLVSIERGHDPGKFVAMPFGGGGSLHTGALIQEVGLACALVPRFPGVTSAQGCLLADMRHDFVQSFHILLEDLKIEEALDAMQNHYQRGLERLRASGLQFVDQQVRFSMEMSYVGQSHGLHVPFDAPEGSQNLVEVLSQAFDKQYQATFGALLAGVPKRVMTLQTTVTGYRKRQMHFPKLPHKVPKPIQDREVWFGGERYKTAIWERSELPAEFVVSGPSIVEQQDTTIVIDPGLVGVTDAFGNLIVRRA